jgi:hypothetical protein
MKVKILLRTISSATIQVINSTFSYWIVILRRFENDIIFEELGNWNGMANYVIGNIMAVIFEKYGTYSPN